MRTGMRIGSPRSRRARSPRAGRTWWTARRTSTGRVRASPRAWRSWPACCTRSGCRRRGQRRRSGGRRNGERDEGRAMTAVVQWLLLLDIGAHIVLGMYPGMRIELAFIPLLILDRPWTLITYTFVHAGFFHLLMNMLGLYFFGP